MGNDFADTTTNFHQAGSDQKVAAFLAYAKKNVTPGISDNDLRHNIAMTLTSAVQYDQIIQDPIAGPILDVASQDLDFGHDTVGQDRFDKEWDKLVSLVSKMKS
jgi:hypothetical protein